jgi:hypothetical protein
LIYELICMMINVSSLTKEQNYYKILAVVIKKKLYFFSIFLIKMYFKMNACVYEV